MDSDVKIGKSLCALLEKSNLKRSNKRHKTIYYRCEAPKEIINL